MNRLDAIKERAKVVATKPENREATYAEFGAVLRLACFDVPALVAAVEAVSAIPFVPADCNGYLSHKRIGYNNALSEVHAAIREALVETT